MIPEERVIALMSEANPAPALEQLDPVVVDATVYLVALNSRSSEVTNLDTRTKEKAGARSARTTWTWIGAVAALLVVVGVIAILTNNEAEAPSSLSRLL